MAIPTPSTSAAIVSDDPDAEYRKLRWLYTTEELLASPSAKDDLDATTEARYRYEGGKLIYAVGSKLGIKPWPTLGTACYYFQRFYMVNSFRKYNRNVTALACLFLAAKVEEEPKKCPQIVDAAKECIEAEQIERMGSLESEIIYTESRILTALRFDLTIKHPYLFVAEYTKIFTNLEKEKDRKKQLIQGAFGMINDCNRTTLLLQHEPEIIAIAAIHLASKMFKVDLVYDGKTKSKRPWYDRFVENMTEEYLKEICDTVLDLHDQSQKQKAPTIASSQAVPPPPPPPELGSNIYDPNQIASTMQTNQFAIDPALALAYQRHAQAMAIEQHNVYFQQQMNYPQSYQQPARYPPPHRNMSSDFEQFRRDLRYFRLRTRRPTPDDQYHASRYTHERPVSAFDRGTQSARTGADYTYFNYDTNF